MKKIAMLFILVSISCTTPVQKTQSAAESKPVSDECIFNAQISHGNDIPMGLCMYTHKETRGIFAATACVTVLIEGQTQTRHPFYGSKGHWGIEGICEAKSIIDKLKDPETMKTVNPISDLKMKRKAGKTVEILKDDFKISSTLLEVTKP